MRAAFKNPRPLFKKKMASSLRRLSASLRVIRSCVPFAKGTQPGDYGWKSHKAVFWDLCFQKREDPWQSQVSWSCVYMVGWWWVCTRSKTQHRVFIYVCVNFKGCKTTFLTSPEFCVWIKLRTAASELHSKLRPSRPLEPRLHWQVRVAFLRVASLFMNRRRVPSKELSPT